MFRVVWEIQLDADTPLDAAKTALDWIREDNTTGNAPHQFYVQEEDKNELFSVDLIEDDEDAVLPVTEYNPLIELITSKPIFDTSKLHDFYFDLHVFHSRNDGFSVPVRIQAESKPTEEQVIENALINDLIDSEDAKCVDYVDDIDSETYIEMGGKL